VRTGGWLCTSVAHPRLDEAVMDLRRYRTDAADREMCERYLSRLIPEVRQAFDEGAPAGWLAGAIPLAAAGHI
jgi:hypothetical protein